MSERNVFHKQNTNKSSKNVEHTQTTTISTCTCMYSVGILHVHDMQYAQKPTAQMSAVLPTLTSNGERCSSLK